MAKTITPIVPRDKTREAHATFDRTRCAAWLAATGNRPRSKVGIVDQETTALLKSPQPVEKRAKPNPGIACDVHPVEDV